MILRWNNDYYIDFLWINLYEYFFWVVFDW